MSSEDTQPLDPRELLDDPSPSAPAQQEGTTVSFDWSWFKSTGLDMAQHAANTFILVGTGDAFDLLHFDWKAVLGLCGGAAVVAFARAVTAYHLPDKPAKAISATANSST